jgi:demethoxyubiquinone hydroxylase (CLK1/Coq7/Cat5 family)
LFEDLYPLKLMATVHVENVIEKAYNDGLHLTETAREIKETISLYKEKEENEH